MLETCSDNDSDHSVSESHTLVTEMATKKTEHTPLQTMGDSNEVEATCCSMCHKDYPRGVLFIIANEFCERFSYYGMRAILVIYLTQWLAYSDDTATVIFHSFVMLCYVSPIFGAMLADGYIGKYKTILYLSVVYAIGNIIISCTSLPPAERIGPLIGLLLIGFGTGGIKPCVCAFGGDQFASNQEAWLNQFFSVFYLVINLGSFFSMLLTPILREDIRCFGGNCYPIAFGIPALLMIISLFCFVGGRKLYKRNPPTGNVIAKMLHSIWYALKHKLCGTTETSHAHWLDHANDKYDVKFVDDVKATLRVLFMFLPLPLFWALFDQQGSRWTLQAMKLTGSMGDLGRIRPDQMQAINALLIIVLIPIFDSFVYPLFAKCHLLKRPLQRMMVGMFLAGAAFVIAGFLEMKIVSTIDQPTSDSSVRFINALPCHIRVESDVFDNPIPNSHASLILPVSSGNISVHFAVSDDNYGCHQLNGDQQVNYTVQLDSSHAYYVVVYGNNGNMEARQFEHPLTKPTKGGALVNVVFAAEELTSYSRVVLYDRFSPSLYSYNVSERFKATDFKEIEPSSYTVEINFDNFTLPVLLASHLDTDSGGVYTVIIQQTGSDEQTHGLQMVEYVDVPPNRLHMLWQTPQYVVMTCGEVMFSVTGLSFAYSQTPSSMKAVVQAGWLITVGVGNLIVVVFTEVRITENQATEFFIFALLMAIDMVIFGVMCYSYVYVKHQNHEYLDIDGNHGNDDDTLVAHGEQEEEMDFEDGAISRQEDKHL